MLRFYSDRCCWMECLVSICIFFQKPSLILAAFVRSRISYSNMTTLKSVFMLSVHSLSWVVHTIMFLCVSPWSVCICCRFVLFFPIPCCMTCSKMCWRHFVTCVMKSVHTDTFRLKGDDEIVLRSLTYITIFNLLWNFNRKSKRCMASNKNSIWKS